MSFAAEVREALGRMRNKRAVLVGDFVLDTYVYGETERVSREAPVLVVRKEREEYRLGAAANTAANLAALGLSVEVTGWIGDDAAGARVRALLSAAGCGSAPLCVAPALSTPVKTRVLAGAFGTSRQQVLRLDAGTSPTIDADTQARIAATVAALAADADVVVVSDYGMGSVGPAVRDVLRGLAAQGMTVCVDSRSDLKHYVGMTAVTPNMPEAEAFIGETLCDAAAVAAAGDRILRELACEACLLTQGKGGMTLFTRHGGREHVDVVGDAEVTDVTGAGDTVIATLAAALAAGLGLRAGMLLANCAAGIVVTRQGTACAAPEEIAASAVDANVRLFAGAA